MRLKGFDYHSPFFYMVTLRRLDGLAAFSEIGPDGLVPNRITRAFDAVIRDFPLRWRCLEGMAPFVVMPDHIHLMLKLATPEKDAACKPVTLGVIVSQLIKSLTRAYWETVAPEILRESASAASLAAGAAAGKTLGGTKTPAKRKIPLPPVFSSNWHDWIVKRHGQLATFDRYIRENPARAWNRRVNARFFQRVNAAEFLGRRWFAYGNPDILDLPVLVAFKGHRATSPGSTEWIAAVDSASRIGPGGAAISTFMSPLEKACGNAAAKAGGRLVLLAPEGFSPRWHPSRKLENLCADGRLLFLSLYEADTRQPSKTALHNRCHKMIDLAIQNFPAVDA